MTRQDLFSRLYFAAAAFAAVLALSLTLAAWLTANGWFRKHGYDVESHAVPLLLFLGWSAGAVPFLGAAGVATRRGWWLRRLAQGAALLWVTAPLLLHWLPR
jgi:hypothetical protein